MRPGSARELVGREAVGVVRGEAVDEEWRGGSGFFGALPEGQEDSACFLEAAPRCEGRLLAGAESSFDGGEGVGDLVAPALRMSRARSTGVPLSCAVLAVR